MQEHVLINEIKAALNNAKVQLDSDTPSNAVVTGDSLFDAVFEKVNLLRKQSREESEVIELLESLAQFYLDCGDKFFQQNKNATRTVDKMLKLSNITLEGINYSETTKNRLDTAYQQWHWHGW